MVLPELARSNGTKRLFAPKVRDTDFGCANVDQRIILVPLATGQISVSGEIVSN